MKVLAFSDLHLSSAHAAALVDASKEADLVIGAGDFCNMRRGLAEAMDLLSGIAAPIVAVPGNAESCEELRLAAPSAMTVLHGEGTAVDGVDIFGIGYAIPQTPFGAWSCDLTEEAAAQLLDRCAKADLLISHSPPKGVADIRSGGQSIGSTAVRDAAQRLKPQLLFCGHVHDSWGKSGQIGSTQVYNLGPGINWFEV